MYSDLLERFKEHLHVLNRSPATISAYTKHTELFLKAVSVEDIRQVTTTMIEFWINDLYDYRNAQNQPYSVATIGIKIRSIKRFFEFLEKANAIFIDPAEFVTEPKLNKNKIKPTLTAKEVRLILDQPNLGTLTGIRDRTVLETFYSTGIRVNELQSLTIYDVDVQTCTVKIKKGKGYKTRVVPLGKHAVKFFKEYISKVRPTLSKEDKTTRILFLNQYSKPLSKQVIATMLKRYVKAAKIKKKVTAHTFRHTFATLSIKNGADLRAVQKMLGHEDLKTTQVYIRSLVQDIKKVHQKTHPREKDKERIPTP
ncbi:MAG: tyrosine-type recombinase/integrase [Desulfobacula sp.]|nr:tyrosine-type recombinase/integrase [Desulfobacula sp.]